MKRNILIAVLVIAVAGAFIGYRMYNERTPTASEKKADLSVEAVALFQAFSQDETAAGKLYNDKVIQVQGTVREVSAPGSGPVNVLLETGDVMGAVVCEFPTGSAPDYQKGQVVTIKGFCAGFNLDVLLQRCAAVE
jgi:tRNA_anti-like